MSSDCPVCSKEFDSEQGMKSHCGQVHPGYSFNEIRVCDNCDDKFERPPWSRSDADYTFCGRDCQSEWQSKRNDNRPWRDEETLRELYYEENLSTTEIADELGCGNSTVQANMDRLGIERRSISDARRLAGCKENLGMWINQRGYEITQTRHDGEDFHVLIHRLLAVSEYGFEAVKGMHVHHRDNIPWLNTPGNIELLTPEDHASLHKTGENNSTAKLDWESVSEIRQRYHSGEAACELADEYGVVPRTIHEVVSGKRWSNGSD